MEQPISWAVKSEFLTFRYAYVFLLVSTLTYLIYWIWGKVPFKYIGKTTYIIGGLLLTASIVFRYFHTGRLPLIHSYEVFVAFVWMMLIIGLVADRSVKNVFASTFTSFFVAAAMIYIETHADRSGGTVVPALQSNWLTFHVVTTLLGYASFAVGFLAAEAYLVNKYEWLEEMSYKLSAFGFPFLTVGIVSGSIWAQEAWGTWWGWDPKETASLIMWLVYAAYLHMRLVRGWRGSKAAWMNIIGFLSMLFCFVGLNFISQVFDLNSEHTYAESGNRMAYFLYMVMAIAVVVFIGGWILKLTRARSANPGSKDSNG